MVFQIRLDDIFNYNDKNHFLVEHTSGYRNKQLAFHPAVDPLTQDELFSFSSKYSGLQIV